MRYGSRAGARAIQYSVDRALSSTNPHYAQCSIFLFYSKVGCGQRESICYFGYTGPHPVNFTVIYLIYLNILKISPSMYKLLQI